MIGLVSKKTSDALIFFSLVIFAGGAFVTYNFFIKPMTLQLKGAQKEIAALSKKKVAAENLAALEQKYAAYDKILSSSQLMSWLIDESSRLAADSNVMLVSAAPGAELGIPDFRKISLRIEARGGYHELGDFVSRIENSERFIKVSDVHAELPAGTEDEKGLRISMTVSIFTQSGP